jgi:hypothetical protein
MRVSLIKSIMLLSLDFMPPDEIDDISLNGLRRRVVTRCKTLTRIQMDESSVALDTRHSISSIGAPLLSFIAWKIICWRIFEIRVSLSEAQWNL